MKKFIKKYFLSQSVSRSRAQSRARLDSSSSSSSSDEEKRRSGPRRSRSPVVNGYRQREYQI